MIPKQKAIELVEKFTPYGRYHSDDLTTGEQETKWQKESGIAIAIVCVSAIIEELNLWCRGTKVEIARLNIWTEVKNELEKM